MSATATREQAPPQADKGTSRTPHREESSDEGMMSKAMGDGPSTPPAADAASGELQDYQHELKKESDSHDAAAMADVDASSKGIAFNRDVGTGDSAGLTETYASNQCPPLHFSGGYAMAMSEQFKAKIDAYFAEDSRNASTGSDVYKTMKRQVDGYVKDANEIRIADMSYSLFASASDNSARALVRVESLQAGLPEVASDETDFSAELAGHEQGLQAGVKQAKLRQSHGHVSNAARDFENARKELETAVVSFTRVISSSYIGKLNAQLREKSDEREEIQAHIESVEGGLEVLDQGLEVVGSMAGAAAGLTPELAGEEELELQTEGGIGPEQVKGATEHAGGILPKLAAAVAEWEYGPALQQIQNQMEAMTDEIASYEGLGDAADLRANVMTFANKQDEVASKFTELSDAIADQRDAYAEVGVDADDWEKAHHARKKGEPSDKIAQIMLYMSAVREASVLLGSTMSAYQSADAAIDAVRAAMFEHNTPWLEHHAGGDNYPMDVDLRPDWQLFQTARRFMAFWSEAAKENQKKLDKLEASAATAMSSQGGVSGKY